MRTLPGGGLWTETNPVPGLADIRIEGEVDVFDQYVIVDQLTAAILEGATVVHIDASGLAFVDIRVLAAVSETADRLALHHGHLSIDGLAPAAARVWSWVRGVDVTAPAVLRRNEHAAPSSTLGLVA